MEGVRKLVPGVWRHHSGRLYRVKYPQATCVDSQKPKVVFICKKSGRVFIRDPEIFMQKTLVDDGSVRWRFEFVKARF